MLPLQNVPSSLAQKDRGGISAFPSMHVAIATWLAISLRDRGLGWLGVTHLLGVFIASVILGWHFALDGVAGIAVALVADRIGHACYGMGGLTLALLADRLLFQT